METAVTIIFPHVRGQLGLQQRASVLVQINSPQIPCAIHVNAMDAIRQQPLRICPKQKKDHDCVTKTLNQEFFEGGAKVDVTFYCKGINSGGCKTKKPTKVFLSVTVVFADRSFHQFDSSSFIVKGNRRQPTSCKKPGQCVTKTTLLSPMNMNVEKKVKMEYAPCSTTSFPSKKSGFFINSEQQQQTEISCSISRDSTTLPQLPSVTNTKTIYPVPYLMEKQKPEKGIETCLSESTPTYSIYPTSHNLTESPPCSIYPTTVTDCRKLFLYPPSCSAEWLGNLDQQSSHYPNNMNSYDYYHHHHPSQSPSGYDCVLSPSSNGPTVPQTNPSPVYILLNDSGRTLAFVDDKGYRTHLAETKPLIDPDDPITGDVEDTFSVRDYNLTLREDHDALSGDEETFKDGEDNTFRFLRDSRGGGLVYDDVHFWHQHENYNYHSHKRKCCWETTTELPLEKKFCLYTNTLAGHLPNRVD